MLSCGRREESSALSRKEEWEALEIWGKGKNKIVSRYVYEKYL